MKSNEEKIKVECKEITKDGTLQCDITTQDLTKMNRLGIKPENIQFNVKDKISIPKSTQETAESVEAIPEPETKEESATESTETVQPQTEQKPEEPATETTEKPSCGCFTSDKTENTDSEA